MTTLADFRGRVLYALGITATSTERGFDNASVDRHIQQAVEELSLYLPGEVSADLAVAAGARTVALAALSRVLRVQAVEYPLGQRPRALLDFDVWGGLLTLDHDPPTAAYTVRVYFTQQHLVDATGSTVAVGHENLVVEGAAALAILARAMGFAQVVESATTPINVHPHLRVAQERLLRWRELLRRLGNPVRSGALYAPGSVPASRFVVSG